MDFLGLIPDGNRNIYPVHSTQTDSGAHPIPYPVGTWGYAPGFKLAACLSVVPRSRIMQLCFDSLTSLYGIVVNYVIKCSRL
jgi:hypothetical protein